MRVATNTKSRNFILLNNSVMKTLIVYNEKEKKRRTRKTKLGSPLREDLCVVSGVLNYGVDILTHNDQKKANLWRKFFAI